MKYPISRRKKYIINPRFQLNLIGRFFLLTAVNVIIFYGAIYYFFWDFKKKGLALGLPKDHALFTFLDQQQYQMDIVFIFAGLCSVLLFYIAGVLISHKIAGPLYKMTNHFNTMADSGEKKEVQFRKGDFFLELKDAYNRFIKSQN
jgi:hypothetical protein